MEEMGIIINNKGKEALVKIRRHSLCSKCTNKCQLAMEDSHESEEIKVNVSNPLGAETGQMVKIEMGEQSLVIASLMVYIIPLVSLILGYFLGQFFMHTIGYTPTEGAGLIGSVLFLAISFLLIKSIDKIIGKKNEYKPTIKEIIK